MYRILFVMALCVASIPSHAQNPFSGAKSFEISLERAETCEASQYGVGDGYHGKKAANGSIFNTYADHPYTVAHKTRKFGSQVKITNLANDRFIIAIVTDRGPYIKGRCVDLGRAGANAIGMGGLAKVRIE